MKIKESAKIVARRTYDVAVELFAALCRKFDLDPLKDGVIISHWEGYRRGVPAAIRIGTLFGMVWDFRIPWMDFIKR